MRDGSSRWMRWSILGALACWLGLPGTGRAQSSLFPDMSIRRSRVPCELEDPRITIFRRQYYGYYPTCWRQFPPGWACPCPNPMAPNWAAAKVERPIEGLEPEAGTEEKPGGTPPGTAPGTGAEEGRTGPLDIPDLPKSGDDPFNFPANPPAQPDALRERGLPDAMPDGEAPQLPTTPPERPEIAPPLDRPGAGAPPNGAEAAGPVLAPPAAAIPALESAPVIGPAPGAALAPEVAPAPRRSFFSSLFAGRGRRR